MQNLYNPRLKRTEGQGRGLPCSSDFLIGAGF
jgi:hypothetical protein